MSNLYTINCWFEEEEVSGYSSFTDIEADATKIRISLMDEHLEELTLREYPVGSKEIALAYVHRLMDENPDAAVYGREDLT